jgi:pimeloyl-ACP methyl ester carboxylesterase
MLILSFLLLSSGPRVFAHLGAAGISGAVTDQQGGAVVGADITVKNKATGQTRKTKSDEDGIYRLQNLPSAVYEVRVEARLYNWLIDKALLDRAGNQEIQLQLFYDYRSNLPLYPQRQAYFRKHQPPTLIVWGKNDQIFPAEGAYPYKRDLRNIEFYLLNTGHFALEEESGAIANYIRKFLHRNVQRAMEKKSPSNR